MRLRFLTVIVVSCLFFFQNFAQGETEFNAIDAYNHLVENVSDEDCNPCNIQLAKHAFEAGLYKKAIEHSEILIQADSSNVKALNILSLAYSKRGNYCSAYKMTKKLTFSDSVNSLFQKRLARLAIKTDKPSEAITAYLAALEINPNDEEAGHDLARLLYSLNLYKEAEHIASQFIQLHPDHPGLTAILAKTFYQLKDYSLSVHWAQKYISMQDTSSEMARIIAVSLVKSNQCTVSFPWFNYLAQRQKMSESLYFHLATVYERLGLSDSALVNYEKALAVSKSPNEGQYHLSLALLLDAKKEYKEAIEHYKIAYSLLKKKEVLYYLARASDNYYRDLSVALNYYEKYVELSSDDTTSETLEYASYRISEIKTVRHLTVDTL